jgi:predicted DCC family thiol-disulfide oxidoreductase YuxK
MGEQSSRIEVYTDGQCPLCRWMRAQIEPYDRDQRIEWLDYNDSSVRERAAQFTREELAAQMHARTPEGRWSKGYQAWVEVLRVLPSWRWLVPIFSTWPFASLGPVFYRWLAKRRYTIFGVPPSCEESGVCRLHMKEN